MAAADYTPLVAAVVSIVGFFMTLVLTLIAYIVRDIRQQITRNSRHIDATMSSLWSMTWRVTTVEDYLAERYGYHPPRLINEPPPPPP